MLRELLFFFVIICAGTGGEIAVSRAMKEIGEVHDFSPRNLFRVIRSAFRVGWMWCGIALMALGFFALLMLLSIENVSFVVPVTALSYAAGAFGGKYLLGERVSPMRWVGVILVCLGVTIVCIG
jgi:drug/metabolite transporter (DMT)-like permease